MSGPSCLARGGHAGQHGCWAESLTAPQLSSVPLQMLLCLGGTCSALHFLATLLVIAYKSELGVCWVGGAVTVAATAVTGALPCRPRLQARCSVTLRITWPST